MGRSISATRSTCVKPSEAIWLSTATKSPGNDVAKAARGHADRESPSDMLVSVTPTLYQPAAQAKLHIKKKRPPGQTGARRASPCTPARTEGSCQGATRTLEMRCCETTIADRNSAITGPFPILLIRFRQIRRKLKSPCFLR